MMNEKKKIGILGLNIPYNSNFENMGKIISSEFQLDIIGNVNANEKIKEIYTIKNYTSIKGKNQLTWFIRDIINLWHYCRKEKPEIICSLQNPDTQAPLIVIFGKLFKKKTVVRFSGGGFDNYKLKKGIVRIITYFSYNWFMRLIKYSDKIICMGQEQKDHLIKGGCKANRIEVLLQPIDESTFVPPLNREEAKLKLEWDLKKKYLLYVGTLQKRKGIDSFVKIIPLINKIDPNFVFVLVGRDDDNYAPKFNKIPSEVVKLLEVDYKKVVDYYQAADILVHPALNEGFPKTVLEAASCGLPVIARDIVGVGRIADKIFVTDKEFYSLILENDLVTSNKSKIPPKYRWENLKDGYVNLFKDLLSDKKSNENKKINELNKTHGEKKTEKKLIIFDLDDTLVDTWGAVMPHAISESITAMVESGLIIGSFENASNKFQEINKSARNGAEALQSFLNEIGADKKFFDIGKEAFYNHSEDYNISTLPGALETLHQLRTNYDFALVSKGIKDIQLKKMKKAGLNVELFKKMMFVDDYNKKEPYQEVFSELGVSVKDSVVIGDRYKTDLIPAKELGAKTICILSGRGKHNPPQEGDVDFIVKDFNEIKNVVE